MRTLISITEQSIIGVSFIAHYSIKDCIFWDHSSFSPLLQVITLVYFPVKKAWFLFCVYSIDELINL